MIENDKVIVLHSGDEAAQFMLGVLYTPATEASRRVGDPSRFIGEWQEPFMRGGVLGYLDDKVVVTDFAQEEKCLKA